MNVGAGILSNTTRVKEEVDETRKRKSHHFDVPLHVRVYAWISVKIRIRILGRGEGRGELGEVCEGENLVWNARADIMT